jgi:protease I
MAGKLDGKKIAFLVANEGTEQVELTEPWNAVEQLLAQLDTPLSRV